MKYPIIKETTLGLTNQNYLSDNQLLIRYSNKYCDDFLDRKNEIKIINLLKAINYEETLPIVDYGFDDNHFYLASKFEPELYTLERIGISRAYLSRIAALLKRFHKINYKTAAIKVFDPIAYLDYFISKLDKKLPNGITAETVTKIKDQIKNMNGCEFVLCHNDLVPGNFAILYNHLYLIDFEYAMVNDFVFDVASFISESLKKSEDIVSFLEEWNLTSSQLARLDIWIDYQNLLWTLWATYLFQVTKNPVYQEIATEKCNHLLNPIAYDLWSM